MIRAITIENFKSIERTRVPMGRVTVLIGENGGGKTNLLEAIALGAVASRSPATPASLVARGVRHSEHDSLVSRFRERSKAELNGTQITVDADELDEPARIEIAYAPGKGWSASHVDRANVMDGVQYAARIQALKDIVLTLQEAVGESENTESVIPMIKAIQLSIQSAQTVDPSKDLEFTEYVVYAPEAEHLRTFREDGQLQPLGARGEGLFRHLQKLQKDHPDAFECIVDSMQLVSWLDGLAIPDDLGPGERRLAIRDRYMLDELDQRSANEGFLFLLFIFTLMWSPETPAFFAIDNVDEALNPKLCREAMKQIVQISAKTGKQVLLTTHNPALLDGLNLNDPDQVLVTVFRDANGRTCADRVPAPRVRKGSKPVRLSEAFLKGYLGGLPDNF